MKTVEQAANEYQASIEKYMHRYTNGATKARIEYDAPIRKGEKAQKKGGVK